MGQKIPLTVTLGEYVSFKQPEIAGKLKVNSYRKPRERCEVCAGEARERELRYLARVMQEVPKNGRGGLLKGEKNFE